MNIAFFSAYPTTEDVQTHEETIMLEEQSYELPVCRIQKFNMKCEIERMEINYTFYFLAFFEKVIKKLLTFCYWKDRKVHPDLRRRPSGCVQFKTDCQSDLYR